MATPCAPLSGWRRWFQDSLLVGGATAVGHALGAVTSLLLRCLLDPVQMGVWQGLKLFLSYGNYAGLGVSKAAARDLSLAHGDGEMDRAKRSVGLAFTVNTLTSALFAITLLAAALWFATRPGATSSLWAAGLAAMAVLAMLQRYVTFKVTLLRAAQSFRATSLLSIQEAVVTLAAAGCATWLWGLPGLYFSTALVLVGSLLFLRRCPVPAMHWAWNRREIHRLIGIGAPLLAAGVVSSLFRSLDKLMILTCLSDGEFQLGCYSLAVMVAAQVYGLANMLGGVMHPRYAELFGHSGSRREVARLAARGGELQAATVALPAALALVACPPFFAWLPAYQSGLASVVWLVIGAVALGLALPATGYLAAINRGRSILACLLLATLIAAIGNIFALKQGYGTTGIAVATMLADLAYLVLVVAISFWIELAAAERLQYLAALALTLAPVLGLAVWLNRAAPAGHGSVGSVVLSSVAVVAVWAVVVIAGWRYGGWRALWREGQS